MEYSMLSLAYLGDAVYEVYVRKYLLEKYSKVNDLAVASMEYVPAKRQDYILGCLIDRNFLTESELDVVRRGRNCKVNSKPRNCDILTYKHATAFEALIGYLYMNDKNRLDSLMEEIFKIVRGA